MGARVEFENAVHFGDRFGIEGRAVIGGNDALTGRAVEMTAPEGDHAIAAIRCVALSAIADDGVIRNTGSDRNFVDRHDEAIVGRQSIDAVWKTLRLQSGRIGGQGLTDAGPQWARLN